MTAQSDIRLLRDHLDDLARGSIDDLAPYELQWPPMPPGFYWRVRWLGSWLLRCLESMRLKKIEIWPAGLKQVPDSARAKPLLIWAVGTDRNTLRAACRGFSQLQSSLPGFVPVLVTDVADFAFFSRLGWLVEYVPELQGPGETYTSRKARFLVRLYRDAPALPARAGLDVPARAEELRRLVLKGTDGWKGATKRVLFRR
ncbi:MAG: hypothetical protein WD795_05830 [Woeseia sp.]